jgi:uncharacterized protein (DUF4415 family)
LLLNRLLIPRSLRFSGTKELVSLRLDKQALAAFKATGPFECKKLAAQRKILC